MYRYGELLDELFLDDLKSSHNYIKKHRAVTSMRGLNIVRKRDDVYAGRYFSLYQMSAAAFDLYREYRLK